MTSTPNIMLVLGLFLVPHSLYAFQTNLGRMEHVYRNVLDGFFSKFSLDDSAVALKGIDISPSLNWFLEKMAIEALTKTGVKQVLVEQDAEAKSGLFEYRSLENEIRYLRIADNKIQRTIAIQLFVKYVEGSGTILSSEILKDLASDTLTKNQVKAVENPSIPFTQGTGRISRLSGTIETTLTLIVSSAIIMLFYFYRSK